MIMQNQNEPCGDTSDDIQTARQLQHDGKIPLSNLAEESFCQNIANGMKPFQAYQIYSDSIQCPHRKSKKMNLRILTSSGNRKRKQAHIAARIEYLLELRRSEAGALGISHARILEVVRTKFEQLAVITPTNANEWAQHSRAFVAVAELAARMSGNDKPKKTPPKILLEQSSRSLSSKVNPPPPVL